VEFLDRDEAADVKMVVVEVMSNLLVRGNDQSLGIDESEWTGYNGD